MVAACRVCGRDGLGVVLSLGEQPLANALLSADQLERPEPRYPLELAFCPDCALAQITFSVPPEQLFVDYPYFSSYADAVTTNAKEVAGRVMAERGLGSTSLVVEVASNDGYLLQHYVQAGIPVLGIDPARNVEAEAVARGVPTLCAFFGEELALQLRDEGKRADVIHANNVIAHVPDVNGVIAGMSTLLADDGVVVVETPYVRHLVERLEFDTIYHEHLFYYSVTALDRLLRRHGLEAVDVEQIPIHGGSLRVRAAHAGTCPGRPSVGEMLAEEEAIGLRAVEYFDGFARRVGELCHDLATLLDGLTAEGRRIAAYGAAAKGTVLLNAAEVPRGTIEFVADRNPHKQGRYMPGVHIPVAPPETLVETMPDYVLLLAWNFAGEVMEQQAEYRARGGRFIVPVPEVRVL